jgi:O-antigen ligase
MKLSQRAHVALNVLLVLFAFLLPISKPASNTALILIVSAWIVEGDWKRKWRVLRASPVFLWFAAWVLFLGISMLWSSTLTNGFWKSHDNHALIYYLRFYLFDFMLLPIMITSLQTRYIRYMISAFLSAMFISEIMSWAIFAELIHYKGISPRDPSPFLHHSLYSIFLAVTIFLLATLFMETKRGSYRLFYAFFMLSAVVNLFLNGGRLGQLAFLVATVVFLFVRFKGGLKTIVSGVLLGTAIFFAAYHLSPVFHKRVDTSIASVKEILSGQYYSSWGIRANVIRVASEAIKEHPLAGAGIGDARRIFLKTAERFDGTEPFPLLVHLHNQYLQILMETGLIGLLIFIGLIVSLLRLDVPEYYRSFHITFIVIYLVGFVGEPLLCNRQPYLLFLMFVALAVIFERERVKL